jgi:hypothetical protein
MDKISINLLVPCVVFHNLDPHTGIPFMPHMAAYLAAKIHSLNQYDLKILDMFGADSDHIQKKDNFYVIGLPENKINQYLDLNAKITFIYCRTIEDLFSVELLIEYLKKNSKTKIILFENIQTTNSFSLRKIIRYLYDLGIDGLIFGEPELIVEDVINYYLLNTIDPNEIPDFSFRTESDFKENTPATFNKKLDNLSFPLWEKFQLNGYWKAGFAHPPIHYGDRFLPLLTSRGCPYRCKFCVSPTLNPVWRSRSADNVVEEIEYFNKKMKINDFHISDLDPTVNDKRFLEIANKLIKKNLNITWKIAQGTKIETIKNYDALKIMRDSGLVFFSFSPESGSKKLMKKLNKPFDYKKSLEVTKILSNLGVSTQACFIAGTPPETWYDRLLSIFFMVRLVKNGLSETALFIYSPIPGSHFSGYYDNFKHYSELTRSPTWRKDYISLLIYRYLMYSIFFLSKLFFQPWSYFKMIKNILNKNFDTKMEMSFYKLFKIYKMSRKV